MSNIEAGVNIVAELALWLLRHLCSWIAFHEMLRLSGYLFQEVFLLFLMRIQKP